jgi:hypothetical protein
LLAAKDAPTFELALLVSGSGKMEKQVRKLVVLGMMASVFALAAAGAGAMGGGRLAPEASPYASFDESFAALRYEGRSTAVGEFYQPAAREQMGKRRQSRHWRHSMALQQK